MELIKDDYNDELERNPGILDGLGQCYHAQEQWNKALEMYELAIE